MHMQRPSMRMQSPGQTQQQSLKQQQQQQAVVGSQANQSQRQVMSPTHMQQLRNLQMEKEQLKKRQDEIARQVQEMLLRAQIPENDIPMMQANEMTSVTDPFLGHSGQGDPHSRQESGDSGLGGMGTSYSLPRTPEDFLSNVDEMDTQDGGPKIQSQSDFSNMDIGNVGGSGENTNMDSDDLVPSLQEDISCELLKDVENVLSSNKVEGLLTWL